ncbi:MAG TPA: IclR family transcriptional regulator [Baekduia sp.]|nr:IclR family transcriptional regulator [Baekduia sp.]
MPPTRRTKAKEPAYPVGSVENALRVLRMLRDRPSVRVSEAAEELSVARSTAHRLLAMLNAYDIVTQDPDSRAYRPGPLLIELGLAALRHDDVLAVLHPFLEELSDTVNETAHVIVLEGSNCRFVDSVESKQALRSTARIGVVYPAYLTSGGKALLSELDAKELRHLFPRRRLPQLTERSPATRDELFEELERIREAGYATNFGESEVGIHAVAMIQRTSTGRPAAAMAVSAPEQRFPEDRVPDLVDVLKDVTARASRQLP